MANSIMQSKKVCFISKATETSCTSITSSVGLIARRLRSTAAGYGCGTTGTTEQAMAYKRLYTYTRESENGASLRAANWKCDGPAGGTHWTGQRYSQTELILDEMKVRWVKEAR